MESPTRRSDTLGYLVNKMDSREEFGLQKYGVSLDREDFTFNEWSVYAEEELMDFLNYNKRMRDLNTHKDAAVDKLLFAVENPLLSAEQLRSHLSAFFSQYHNRSTIQQGAMPHGTQDRSNSGQEGHQEDRDQEDRTQVCTAG